MPRTLRPPRGLLGMLVLMTAVEVVAGRNGPPLASPREADWIRAERVATHRARDADFLVLGDSLAKVGVLPAVLAARSGRRGYGLAVVGGQAPSTYFLLRKALAAGSRPSRVVVDFLPSLLSRDYTYGDGQWPLLLGFRDGLDLAWHARDARLLARVLIGDLLPTCRLREGLRDALKAALDGVDAERDALIRGHRLNYSVNLGAMVLPDDQRGPMTAARWFAGDHPRPWAVDPLNAHYLERFLDLAGAHGVAVRWVVMPVRGSTRAILRDRGEEARYRDYIARIASRHPAIEVVDAAEGFADDRFVDPVHLNRGGALALTERLAATPEGRGIRKLAEARATAAATVVVEDLTRSRGRVR